jgi:hypothetical protein
MEGKLQVGSSKEVHCLVGSFVKQLVDLEFYIISKGSLFNKPEDEFHKVTLEAFSSKTTSLL